MTDTMNVSREVLERLEDMACWLVEEGSDFVMSPSVAQEHSADVRAMLAAAHKAEPEWNYEGALADLDSAITVLIRRINGEADLASAAEWVRLNYPSRASEIVNQPGASKVEQEPVAWTEGAELERRSADYERGFFDGKSTHPAPSSELFKAAKRVVSEAWTDRFGRLHNHPSVVDLEAALAKHKGPQS